MATFLAAETIRGRLHREAHLQYALDLRYVAAFGARAESRRDTPRAGAACPAHAVNIILRLLRQIVIHHV